MKRKTKSRSAERRPGRTSALLNRVAEQHPNKALPWAEERIGLALAESQVTAIQLALMSKVLVMTGGPGVGKTTSFAKVDK